MFRYSFQRLDVWKASKEQSVFIYKLTSDFPGEEKFGLISQMRRAAISVSSNIAEGSSRLSSKDQAYFYQLAYSSQIELINQMLIAKELSYITIDILEDFMTDSKKITNQINALRKATLQKQ